MVFIIEERYSRRNFAKSHALINFVEPNKGFLKDLSLKLL